MQPELLNAFYQTFLMVAISGALNLMIGLPLGLLLTFTAPGQRFARPTFHRIVQLLLKSAQSFPYVILMIALMPITTFLIRKHEGWSVALLPLSLATIPYFAYQCQQAFQRIPIKLIEFTAFLGASPLQIIQKVLLPESLPQLIQTFTHTLVQLTGYSLIAGLLGAQGLGSLAIQKGYPQFQVGYIVTIFIMLGLFVQSLQILGHYLASKVKP